MNIDEPLPIEVTRGSMVESRHEVDVVACDADGVPVLVAGDPARMIYARSAIKPLQALPLVESGAAAHFALDDARVALACASHSGEPVHTGAVAAWLADIGLGEPTLECGPHRPYDQVTDDAMTVAGEKPCRLHNNCSGKHTGFLTTARYLGEDPAGYITEAHPVQQRLIRVTSEMCDTDLSATPRGEDGCGIPVIGIPLGALARGMARMADPRHQGAARGAACGRIVSAMARNPYLIAGRGRLDTALMGAVQGLAIKGGAEGVHIAIVPWKKIGIAVKARCGTERAADAGFLWALEKLDIIDESAAGELADWISKPVANTLKHTVGRIRAAL